MLATLQLNGVQLERVTTRTPSIALIIRVLNVAFEKRVVVRYSCDGWRSVQEAPAVYAPGSSDGQTDRFYVCCTLVLGHH